MQIPSWIEDAPTCIPRELMPQIDTVDLPDFIKHVESNGVSIQREMLESDKLCFRQHIKWELVHDMPDEILRKPILASSEGCVLDGNHRAAAHRKRGSATPAFKLDADFASAMKLLFSFDRTYTYGDGLSHRSF